MVSAYIMAFPFKCLAARPTVWVSERADRKNPSLSASIIATKETSGKSNPSRSKLTPIRTSNNPRRKSCMISTRSKVSISLWIYRHRIEIRDRYLVSSSAMRLVSVVTKTRSSTSARTCISSTKSSIWFWLGLTSMMGSSSPVGRMICSTYTPSVCSNS